jgi:esterase/lipase
MKTTNNVTVTGLNLGGLTFNSKAEHKFQLRKIYKLSLRFSSPEKTAETEVKIAVIGSAEQPDGSISYRTIYRRLSKAQVQALSEITECFKNTAQPEQNTLEASIKT